MRLLFLHNFERILIGKTTLYLIKQILIFLRLINSSRIVISMLKRANYNDFLFNLKFLHIRLYILFRKLTYNIFPTLLTLIFLLRLNLNLFKLFFHTFILPQLQRLLNYILHILKVFFP